MTDFHLGIWNSWTMYFTKKATEVTENFYPGGMGRMYIINFPWIFRAAWAVARGWVDERTRDKI